MPVYKIKIGGHRDHNKKDYHAKVLNRQNGKLEYFKDIDENGKPNVLLTQFDIIESESDLPRIFGREKFERATQEDIDAAAREAARIEKIKVEGYESDESLPPASQSLEEAQAAAEASSSVTDVTSEFAEAASGIIGLKVLKEGKIYSVVINDEVVASNLTKKSAVVSAIEAL